MRNQQDALRSIDLSLLTHDGRVHSRAGLNWGQREGRDPNQAYIPVNGTDRNWHYFPPREVRFTIHTDDGATLGCVMAQDDGKAIETYNDNSILGRYFRQRLGVAPGEAITMEHFLNYGRTNITLTYRGPGDFYLDFSV